MDGKTAGTLAARPFGMRFLRAYDDAAVIDLTGAAPEYDPLTQINWIGTGQGRVPAHRDVHMATSTHTHGTMSDSDTDHD
ncbi:putative ATP-grasp-modified RiPP [Actinoallomurus sp. NPDC052308]|uniref:putative ATP-grasp-modified RiPP n=1 Tax=Actinoallomurus sp. NPDC052308 TaxID=3155530 RepID=UPI00343FE2AC